MLCGSFSCVIQSEAKNPGFFFASPPVGEAPPTRVPARGVSNQICGFRMCVPYPLTLARTSYNESELRGKHSVISEKKDWVANWKMVVDTAKRVRRSNN